jgi:outer membrane protein assembly factor BamB/tetratricopeptide (TPR) repeat protein
VAEIKEAGRITPMSWKARRVSIVLLPLILAASALWLGPGHAQVQLEKKAVDVMIAPPAVQPPGRADTNMNPDGFLNNGIHLVKDEKGRGKQIEAAIDYINDENWATAVQRLQKLLEIDEDVFVRLKRKNAEGNEVFVWVSAKQEADRLIGTLPAAGLDFYRATYGAKAADLLKNAKKTGDPGLLNDIMKKYAHTEAGAEAIKLLGDYKFDRGEYMPALLCYSKLINRLGDEKTPVSILAKAAWAAHLAPPSSSDKNTVTAANVYGEKELWRMLRGRTREVQFGDQAIGVEDLQEHVAKLDRNRLEQNATDSLLYRATVSRSNQLTGGPAFMSREWGVSLLYEGNRDAASEARTRIKTAKDAIKKQNQPIIPAFSPITLSVLDAKGEKKPLLIYKNFFGVMAVDLRHGSLAWASPSNWSLQRMLSQGGSKQNSVSNWLTFYQLQHPQILFENSTVGALSTDGQFVYVVEDLAVPPEPQQNFENGMVFRGGMVQNQAPLDKDLEDAVSHNRLFALSLARSGALTWALGDDEKDPLHDHYFLGPPLPLAGKLYLLADKQQEIRLICLESTEVRSSEGRTMYVPRIVSTQTLGMTQEKMQSDALRRTWAAHLAYGEGILVCPTNAGAVFGVNLLENSLVWAYPYRDKSDATEQAPAQWNGRVIRQQWPPPGFKQLPDGRVVPISNQQNQWKVSAPVISDGKVVFTAPDARSIHCINLRDGSPIWRRPKHDEDLYLGNVYNGRVLIVGKKNVRALSLATGETLWTLETGTPSGQGIGSDNVYYLPLKDGGKGKHEPQIVGIDMDRGRIVSGSKSRPSEPDKNDADIPGNLIFAEGKVISITPFGRGEHESEGEVVAYPQLKVKISEMDDKIAKNPNDANALTERGELRLDKGDLAGAIDDLSTALKNKPSRETREKARAKLYDTLTVYIQDHFNDAERYLAEYEELCKIDLDNAPESERGRLESEQRRRRATYLWLVGKGREEQGRLVEAFEKYQEFAEAGGKQSDLVPAVDDPQVKTAPDVWSRGRIIAMMNNAKPENRQPLEKLIADKWNKLRETNDLKELRSFVRMFGSVSDAGKEARLELVERLMEQKDSGEEHPLLEAELELNQFRTGKHSPELAARATEALGRLYTRKGLLEDAGYCYRKLGKEYGNTVIRDGKTGRQIYDDEAATDKRLLPYLDDPLPLGNVPGFRYKKESGNFPLPGGGPFFQFEHSGEKLPFFRHHIVGLSLDSQHRFMLLDRNLEKEDHTPRVAWSVQLSDTNFQTLSNQVLGHQGNAPVNPGMGMPPINPNSNPHSRFPYSTVGHLIVLPLGQRVYGIDPVYPHQRILWEKSLSSEGSGLVHTNSRGVSWDPQHPPVVDPRDGSVLVTYNDNWAQRLGQVSPFEGQTICVQSFDRLSALDPLTGRTLWSRMDVHSRNYLFSDEDYVFVVELDNQNNPSSSRVFRAADGISVKSPDFAALFAKRLQVLGRYLLLSETTPVNGVVVRLHDIVTGQDVWKEKYPARSIVARSEDAGLTGVVEPSGKVHVIDLRARKEVMSGEMSEESANDLKNVQGFHLLSDRMYYYFASQATGQNGAVLMDYPSTCVMTTWGMRTVFVSGFLHAFDRKSGSLAWNSHIKTPQYLVLDQFEDSPIVFLAARGHDSPNGGVGVGGAGMPGGGMALGGGRQMVVGNPMLKVTSLHKNTGKAVFDEKMSSNQQTNFFGVRLDPRANTVELLSQQLKIIHSPDADDRKRAKPAAESPGLDGAQFPATRPKTAEKKVLLPALDRARIREIAPPLPPG